MTALTPRDERGRLLLATALAFAACFGAVLVGLVRSWWEIPDAAHGLLLGPIALWLAWDRGLVNGRDAAPTTNVTLNTLLVSVTLVFVAVLFAVFGRAAGMDTVPRVGLWLALVALTLWFGGWPQLHRWVLPLVLIALSIPMPESLIAWMTIPLQGVAAKMGAGLLAWRRIPVRLSGNIIRLPGHTLFVSEACSGLRSLTALISMAVLASAIFLRTIPGRVLLVVLAVPLAVLINGLRVFLTGFFVYFVDRRFGEGFMHLTEGYLLFLVSLVFLALLTWALEIAERRVTRA